MTPTPSSISFPFPAAVEPPDGDPIRLARIGIAPDPAGGLLFRVFTSTGGAVQLAHEVHVDAYDQQLRPLAPSKPAWRVTDPDGGVWTVTRGSGCGCGNPLKRFDPDRWTAPAPADV